MTETDPQTQQNTSQDAGATKLSIWNRRARAVLPSRMTRRLDRLPRRSQQDTAHYNFRSGL